MSTTTKKVGMRINIIHIFCLSFSSSSCPIQLDVWRVILQCQHNSNKPHFIFRISIFRLYVRTSLVRVSNKHTHTHKTLTPIFFFFTNIDTHLGMFITHIHTEAQRNDTYILYSTRQRTYPHTTHT